MSHALFRCFVGVASVSLAACGPVQAAAPSARAQQTQALEACGDGTCQPWVGESCASCAADCGQCDPCTTDADCHPTDCCHAYFCGSGAYPPNCGACDAWCIDYSYDTGNCVCQNGGCVMHTNYFCDD